VARGAGRGQWIPDWTASGLSVQMLQDGLARTYDFLDTIDESLLSYSDLRLAEVVELANLSSMLGNILASGIVRSSQGVFERAGPHKYQDLRAAAGADAEDIEIKVALESNRPKGHLPKPGKYLTCRYVLGGPGGEFDRVERGLTVWVWEMRFGQLNVDDFAVSNTAGDSGKTAVVTPEGMRRLDMVYFDRALCPYARVEAYLQRYGGLHR